MVPIKLMYFFEVGFTIVIICLCYTLLLLEDLGSRRPKGQPNVLGGGDGRRGELLGADAGGMQGGRGGREGARHA